MATRQAGKREADPRAAQKAALAHAVSTVIRERMKHLKVSGNALAQATGIPQSSISSWLSQDKTPGTSDLSAIARALGTTGGAILGEAERRVGWAQK